MLLPAVARKVSSLPRLVTAVLLGVLSQFALRGQSTFLTGWESPTPVTLTAAGRILDQASFGGTAADLWHVEQVGVTGYINEQLNTSPYIMPLVIPAADYLGSKEGGDCNGWMCDPEAWWWEDVLFGKDQLRQRVAFSLSKLFQVSYNEVDPRYYPYYLNVLSRDAFGNWLTLMTDVSLSPAMGTYLDMANSQAPSGNAHADENFARELMQLFSIGTVALNEDGSTKQDANGNVIPNYTPAAVQGLARAFTGYTFANNDCSQPSQPRYYWWPTPPGVTCPMMPLETLHDSSQKTLLRGEILPPGQTAAVDVSAALANIFNDPSLPPFVSRRLIQSLVTSNPSPAYIARISAVFINDGKGVRGDLKAVIESILLDSEARSEDDIKARRPQGGMLREPTLWWTSILRALSAQQLLPAPEDGVYANIFDVRLLDLDESPHQAPSVFSFYSPNYLINGGAMYAPEFQLENSFSLASMMRHAQDMIDSNFNLPNAKEFVLDLSLTSPLGQIAASGGPVKLVDALDALLLRGTMTTSMRDSIVGAVTGLPPSTMVKNAVYLVVTSPEYRVMF